jgi:ankyrin repeat protein
LIAIDSPATDVNHVEQFQSNNFYGWPLLTVAVFKQLDASIIKEIIDKTKDIDIPNRFGYTALHTAATLNLQEIVDMLCKAGKRQFLSFATNSATQAHQLRKLQRMGIGT